MSDIRVQRRDGEIRVSSFRQVHHVAVLKRLDPADFRIITFRPTFLDPPTLAPRALARALVLATTISTPIMSHPTPPSADSEDPLARLEREFNLTPVQLSTIATRFVNEMRKGLDRHGATLPMIPTYVTSSVTGHERGSYMALDMGGTNLRVCRVDLEGAGRVSVEQETFVIPAELKLAPIVDLFDWVVSCVELFFTHKGHPLPLVDPETEAAQQDSLYVGFTFSFSVNQTALNRGTLLAWSKGFHCPGLLGTGADIVELLQESFRRRRHRIVVTALVNDTAGTLLACGYQDPTCKVGVILGTGTNAAYYETRSALRKWGTLPHEDPRSSFTEMIINTEWAEFDDERDVVPVTRYDCELDVATNDVGTSIFEKLISGLYLGEVVRLALADLHSHKLVFPRLADGADQPFRTAQKTLAEPYRFTSEYVSLIVADTSSDLAAVAQVLADFLGVPTAGISHTDCVVVRTVCSLVGTRAARLSAVGVAAIFTRRPELLEKEEGSTVAVDGSLFEKYPGWVAIMEETLRGLLGEERTRRIRLRLVKDGSGIGAAIVAMLAAQQQK
ncbi:putative glucokinase [Jimgerdemannia flammicorona]|uniref:Phosphotransferase n=1 Tax=Jimgerdemannia flammicorona TaxID=994334 RepID=A0A433QDI8_9FUNG|nr:putative glucokinase [Jimgerdemannia flammicorona]